MKLLLEKVRIYGFDPKIFKTFDDGKKQYNVALYISEEQKKIIDSYLFNKVSETKDGEFLFYGRSKQPIPVFDPEKKKIEKPINEVFIADVSILIDEFAPKPKYEGEEVTPMRYSKCLGIKYISPLANEAPRVIIQEKFETFDEIFGDAAATQGSLFEPTKKPDLYEAMKKPEELGKPEQAGTFEPTIPIEDDLPF
jgi:hypothetical protein